MSGQTDQIRPPARMLGDLDMRDNCFDAIRLFAAIAVIVSHAFPLTGTPEPLEALSRGQVGLGHLAVGVFFLVSGYLIPASLDRGSLQRYARKRAFRIIPALAVAVLVCAFLLGPLLTVLPLTDYLTAGGTWLFLGNAAFLPVGYDLPGVFADNPLTAVNGSLWSLKFEVACYVIVPIAFAFKSWRVAVVMAGWLASFALAAVIPEGSGGALFYIGLMSDLFRFFGSGMLLYLLADRVPMRRDWAVLAALASVAALFTPVFVEVMATAGSYAIIYFAYHAPRGMRALTARGDISYGVYVYAFPIQQTLVPFSLAAGAAGLAAPWLINFALTLPLTLLAGAMSWVLVEKPFLALGNRKRLSPSLA